MFDYTIRLYKNSDYEKVRSLYARSVMELPSPAFSRTLRLPHIWLFVMVVFGFPLMVFQSFLPSVVLVAIALVFLQMCGREFFHSYIRDTFLDDLKDINKYYVKRGDCCFWVAESAGQVIGMVAACPSSYPGGENHVELKRMSVDKEFRGRGIAKALCRAVINYARERGCKAVILTTSTVQVNAQRLYEKMGFRHIYDFHVPKIQSRFVGIKMVFYQYDIPACK